VSLASKTDTEGLLPRIPGVLLSQEAIQVSEHDLPTFIFEHETGHSLFLVLPDGMTWENLDTGLTGKRIHSLISNHGLQIEKVRVIAIHRRTAYNVSNAAISYHKVLFNYDRQKETITNLEGRYLCKKDIPQVVTSGHFSMKEGGTRWKIT